MGAANAFDLGWGVVQSVDGGFVVTGSTSGFGAGSTSTLDLLLSKFDSDGTPLWTKKLGASGLERGFSICTANQGGYLVAGITNSFGAGDLDLLLAKFDLSGGLVWTKTFGGIRADFGTYYGPAVMQTSDNNIVVAGTTKSYDPDSSEDIILCKFDGNGNSVWTRVLQGDSGVRGNAVVEARDGGYVVAGTSTSFDGGNAEVLLSKFDRDGNHLWNRTIGGAGGEYAAAMVKSLTGGYILTGATTSFGSTYPDFLITALDSIGNHVWTKTLKLGTDSDTRNNFGKCITRLTDGCYVVSGEIVTPSMPEAPLIKLDETGGLCLGTNQFPTVTPRTLRIISPTPTTLTNPAFTCMTISPTITSPSLVESTICQGTANIEEKGGINNSTFSDFFVYPNPVNHSLTIEILQRIIECRLTIYNLNGQELIYQKIKNSKTQIDISNLTSGVYFVKLINDNTAQVRKIIIE